MYFKVGTPLLDILEACGENKTLNNKSKDKILNFCKIELEKGDCLVTNEIEAVFLNTWFNNQDEVIMPKISNKFSLSDKYTFGDKNLIQDFEEYKGDNGYYIFCYTKNKEGDIIKKQLTYRSKPLKDFLVDGGTEDILFDNNNDNIVNSRMIIKSCINDKGVKETKIYNDMNLDGKLD